MSSTGKVSCDLLGALPEGSLDFDAAGGGPAGGGPIVDRDLAVGFLVAIVNVLNMSPTTTGVEDCLATDSPNERQQLDASDAYLHVRASRITSSLISSKSGNVGYLPCNYYRHGETQEVVEEACDACSTSERPAR